LPGEAIIKNMTPDTTTTLLKSLAGKLNFDRGIRFFILLNLNS